ncbi:hypothetical protein SeMB42_g02912 [Synchytrium endobioticum]|uniref:Protein kinase domain-containing protein n=1 Tax=Synchytrium endobioticum TaxID=286115 RepID=A0A507DBC2_9FUNG|nr:hypothetical protein SeMB42_g02912 [Synchytrium endobioticum]
MTPLALASESLALKFGVELALRNEHTVVDAKARPTAQMLDEHKARFMSRAAVGLEIPSTSAVLFLEHRGKTLYAEVHKGQWTNYTVAIKRLLDQQLADEEKRTVRSEITNIRKLLHANIAEVRATCVTCPYISTLVERRLGNTKRVLARCYQGNGSEPCNEGACGDESYAYRYKSLAGRCQTNLVVNMQKI